MSSSSDSHSYVFSFRPVRRFVVNLEDPPIERWREIAAEYGDIAKEVVKGYDDEINDMADGCGCCVHCCGGCLFGCAAKTGFIKYSDDVVAISKLTGMSLGKVQMLQLVYEASAACTAIVAEDVDGIPWHARTLDWDTKPLRRLTIEIDVRKKGRTVFLATTWAGFVGVLTAMRPGAYSVTPNYRHTGGTLAENFRRGVRHRAWPASFLIRDVMENEKKFKGAVDVLRKEDLMSPCFLVVCGTRAGEGALITRHRDFEERPWRLQEHGQIIQLNMDHWKSGDDSSDNIGESRERRDYSQAALRELRGRFTVEALQRLLNTEPVLGSTTLYNIVMCPAKNIYESQLVLCD